MLQPLNLEAERAAAVAKANESRALTKIESYNTAGGGAAGGQAGVGAQGKKKGGGLANLDPLP